MSGAFRVRVNGLRKEYGKRTVLDVGALELESGCAYALVGPNGGGKSTFMKTLSGVIDATGGSVAVERDGDAEAAGLSVGYMPQKSYVFGFSVLKNVTLALDRRGIARDEARERALAALGAVGMADMADARGSGLSGGEAQRVALARILVRDLDVVLLDEPTASMDIAGTMLVEDALRAYREKTGCLMVVATHAPSQAHRIAERTVMLSEGRVVECGPTERVLTAPESDEGRSFLSYWAV